MHTRRAIGLLSAGLLITTCAACSSTSSHGSVSKPVKSSSRSDQTPAGKAKADAPLKLGSGTHWRDTNNDGGKVSGTTTALSYMQPAEVDLPNDAADFKNPVWAVLEVKACADTNSATFGVSQEPWALGFPDDTRLQAPILSGSGVPKPEYASDGELIKAGTCLRGKITFSIEKGTRPDTIVYSPEGRDPIEWSIPKA
ncbi:hypothetical protein [Streptomyces sp. NPDC102360]|uniref:hypothetical protein n=1 Tax=Streptomyces sp. NPDC102360 TaxID=3366160 RepID=UPI0038149CC2